MNLYEKIKNLYPDLKNIDFDPSFGTIFLQNDGQGDYIAKWNNPLPRPTEEQLASIK